MKPYVDSSTPGRGRTSRIDPAAGAASAHLGHLQVAPRLDGMTPAGDFDYEATGAAYSAVRRADPRIAELVHRGLGAAMSVVNVGAGAGSYEPEHLGVVAVEPSASMRSQRSPGQAPALDARAESLPFPNDSFDAAMAMVTVHQWSDQDTGLRELRRVSRGPVVVLTFDGDALDQFWLAGYVPELIAAERRRYPAIDRICDVVGGTCSVTTVPIPIDCTDGFTEAFYARPERFLDPTVRRSQSAWGFVSPEVEQRAVAQLRRDLEGGQWDQHHGSARMQPTYRGSLRLIVSTPDIQAGRVGHPAGVGISDRRLVRDANRPTARCGERD
jgi:hypothetical protein